MYSNCVSVYTIMCAAMWPGPICRPVSMVSHEYLLNIHETKRKKKQKTQNLYGELIFGSVDDGVVCEPNIPNATSGSHSLCSSYGRWYNVVPLLVRLFCRGFFFRGCEIIELIDF